MFNAADVLNSAAFKKASDLAHDYVIDKQKAGELIANATEKLTKMEHSRGPVGEAVRSARAVVRLIQAYVAGEYRTIPLKGIAAAAAAIVYFVMADDVIDDDTAFVGYADDAAVIMLALKLIQGDIDAFLAWEATKNTPAGEVQGT